MVEAGKTLPKEEELMLEDCQLLKSVVRTNLYFGALGVEGPLKLDDGALRPDEGEGV